jgi:hypothetical protein
MKNSSEHTVAGLSVRQTVHTSWICVWPISSLLELGFYNFFTEMITILRRRVIGSLPWRSMSQHDLKVKSCPAHNIVIWSRILQLFHNKMAMMAVDGRRLRTWPIELIRTITKTNILTKFNDRWVKNVTTGVLTRIIHIWAVWPRWTIFKLDREMIKTNFQTNLPDIWIKTVATRVLTRSFYF